MFVPDTNDVVINGDIYIGVLFDLHANSVFQSLCGDITENYQYYEAIKYALSTLNSGQGPVSLRSVTLGGLILDACNNKARAQSLVVDAYASNFQKFTSSSLSNPTSNNVIAWITGSTEMSSTVSDVLKSLNVAQLAAVAFAGDDLSAASTSFYRTLPSENVAISAIVQLLKYMQWNYVQVVTESDYRGKTASANLQSLAGLAEICVVQTIQFDSSMSADVILSLLQQQQQTNVILVFASVQNILSLLQANMKAATNFTFIINDASNEVYNLNKIGSKLVQNAVVIIDNMPILSTFDTYLSTLKLPSPVTLNNLWLAQYFESLFRCSLTASNRYSVPCNISQMNLVNSNQYKQNHYVASVIAAVYAAAGAIDLTLKQYCGDSYTTACASFTQAGPQLKTAIASNLMRVNYLLTTQNTFSFTSKQYVPGYRVLFYDSSGNVQLVI